MHVVSATTQKTFSLFFTAKIFTVACFLLATLALSAQAIPAPGLVIGSGNTATADPALARPNTTPCVVTLFANDVFADFSSHPFSFTPPAACPGPWAKVVLNADFSIQAGLQFDRTANIWIGGVNVYFGTTSEPSGATARAWHIERDLTDYSALLNSTQSGRVDLGNIVNSQFTSSLFGTATLQFYPLDRHEDAARTADMILPLASDPTGGTTFLNTTTDTLAKTFTLPANVERAFIDVISQSQGPVDEFWYTCVPNDVTTELQSCGNTGFRESEITIDGVAAGVAPVYPWIYTGGIDPLLWRPIPGVQTLNFPAYRVDLTPFAALLSNGQPHQVAVSVFNANVGFSTTATLLVFQDQGAKQITGALTRNTLGPPSPNVVEKLNTAADGTITGFVTVSATRDYRVEGFVETSHGRVETSVRQNIQFTNRQDFNITDLAFVQNIKQRTTISSETSTNGQGGGSIQQQFEWPLDMNINFVVNADGSGGFQTTTVKQQFQSATTQHGDGPSTFSVVSNTVTPSDTLVFDANFNITGFQGQQSAQEFFSNSSADGCFSRKITAANGLLTSVTNGALCNDNKGK
ncbi:MAG TPA: peptide-N4-asparagine amidase [Candidatus Angelobacter sp.]|nr:peptide-N4-asparagine amidase [Candidatus Angelobacter sp.]